jgi:hypothetical protein
LGPGEPAEGRRGPHLKNLPQLRQNRGRRWFLGPNPTMKRSQLIDLSEINAIDVYVLRTSPRSMGSHPERIGFPFSDRHLQIKENWGVAGN